jgi:hypothetical protein
MKNHNPAGRRLHFASAGQRLFAIFVLAVFGYLIWLAWTGRYDAEVNRLAAWLGGQYHALVN